MKSLSPTLRGAVWMIGAIISFSAMAVAGRAVASDLDTFELMMYRSAIGVVVVILVGAMARSLGDIKFTHLGLHGARNLSHFAGQNLWFYAISVIPLGQVFALEFTSPIWVLVFAPFVLGEKLTRGRVIAALFGFAGILIVAQPGVNEINPGVIAAAASAIGFALSAVFTRRLTRSHKITSILFFLTVMQLGFGVVAAGFDGDIAWPKTSNIPWLIVIALAGLVAHFCLTRALTIAPASVVIPVDFLRLPLIILIGALFYDETVNGWVVLGAAVIFGSNYLNLLSENRKKSVT